MSGFVPDILSNKSMASLELRAHTAAITARSMAFICDENAPIALPPSSDGKERALTNRRRFKQTLSLQDRLQAFAGDVRAKAEALPPGTERDGLLEKARQADTASHLNEWAIRSRRSDTRTRQFFDIPNPLLQLEFRRRHLNGGAKEPERSDRIDPRELRRKPPCEDDVSSNRSPLKNVWPKRLTVCARKLERCHLVASMTS